MSKYLIFKLSFILSVVFLFTNCTKDFSDINTDKKSLTEATPDLLLPGIIVSTASIWTDVGGEEGLVVTQHAGLIQSTGDDTYDWDANSKPYDDGYALLRDIYNMMDASESSNALKGYYGIGLILKCVVFQIMTDAYGSIPYTEAIQGKTESDFTPSFDSQDVIYYGMLDDLEAANDTLANTTVDIDGDILYSNDIEKWQKFANSLRLRLLMRIVDVDSAYAVSGIQEIINDPDDYPLFESNDDMAALSHDSDNPPHRYDSRSGTFDTYRLSNTLEDRLKELNDTRLKVFAQPISASDEDIYSPYWDDYQGIQNGLGDDESESYSPTGDSDKAGSNYISKLGILYACETCNDASSDEAAQSIIMSYSEVEFLIAEAIEKGYVTSSDAETYYQNGIEASFEYYKGRVEVGGWTDIYNALDSTDMTTYCAQEGVAFSGDQTEDLNKIYLQKWFTQFYVGMEAWSNWRRTNEPEVVPGPAASNDGEVPVRFLYPDDVKSYNYDNYLEAVEDMGGDELYVRLWWDTADND